MSSTIFRCRRARRQKTYSNPKLLGDRADAVDGTFLHELFLPCLPGNVQMTLASTNTASSLEDLAEFAGKMVEVVIPSVTAIGSSHEMGKKSM